MKKISRCLPMGSLPYVDEKAATKMMVKLFENIPYLPDCPLVDANENLFKRTLTKTPGFFIRDNKVIFNNEANNLNQKLVTLDAAYNNPNEETLEPYSFNMFFMSKFFQIIERIKPVHAVIDFLGPFSIAQKIQMDANNSCIKDKLYRKSVIQIICVKAIWIIEIIKLISPDTIPIVMLDEPLLFQLGSVKRNNEEVTSDSIVKMYAKIVEKLHEHGAKVGIQCLSKCDWNVPIDAGVDYISFDAYNNPNNLNIIAEKINNFLAHGGKINWAIVPVKNEEIVKMVNADMLYDRLMKTINGLIDSGVSEKLAFNRSMVSVDGDMSHLPILFAEKAMILANQIAKKLPVIR